MIHTDRKTESRRWNEGGPTQLTSTLGLVGLPIAWGVPPFWTLPRMHAKGETNILNYNTIIIRNNYNNYYNNDYNHKLHSKIIHFVSPIDKALSWNISMYPAFLSKCVAMELPLTIADSGRSPPSIIRSHISFLNIILSPFPLNSSSTYVCAMCPLVGCYSIRMGT